MPWPSVDRGSKRKISFNCKWRWCPAARENGRDPTQSFVTNAYTSRTAKKNKATTQRHCQESSTTQRLRADLGRSVGMTSQILDTGWPIYPQTDRRGVPPSIPTTPLISHMHGVHKLPPLSFLPKPSPLYNPTLTSPHPTAPHLSLYSITWANLPTRGPSHTELLCNPPPPPHFQCTSDHVWQKQSWNCSQSIKRHAC